MPHRFILICSLLSISLAFFVMISPFPLYATMTSLTNDHKALFSPYPLNKTNSLDHTSSRVQTSSAKTDLNPALKTGKTGRNPDSQTSLKAITKLPKTKTPNTKTKTKTKTSGQKENSLAKTPLSLKIALQQAHLHLKQNKLDKAISGYADIIVQKKQSDQDGKIQQEAIAALKKMQRKKSPYRIQKHTLHVTSTAYSSHVNQTDSTPWIAAWGDRLKDGMKIIAVSNDLLKMGLGRGSRVKIHGIEGHFVVLDKMNRRWRKRIDIYTGGDLQAARRWGKKTHDISFLTGLDLKTKPAISKKHYNYSKKYYSKKYYREKPLSPKQKALAGLKIRCNQKRASCKRWVFLKRKAILRRFSKR